LAYLGNRPAESFASFEKQVFTIVNSQTAYTLSHSVTNENDIRLVVNSVVQEPGSGKAYTASGTTLTLSAALTNGTDTMYCVFLGRALQTVNAPNASVGSDQTAPTIITGQTAETSIATDDTILIHDTSASALRKMTRANFVSGIGGTNTPAFHATNGSTDQSINDATQTKVDFGTEIFDTDSAFASSRFTVPSAGKYYLFASVDCLETDSDMESHNIYFFKNGSAFVTHTFNNTSASLVRRISTYFGTIFDLSASDYIEIYFQFNGVSNNAASIKSGGNNTFFGGYKLIT
jgi:hypothetical protein